MTRWIARGSQLAREPACHVAPMLTLPPYLEHQSAFIDSQRNATVPAPRWKARDLRRVPTATLRGMSSQIRLLADSDAGELCRLRRTSLLDSPSAFLSSPEDDIAGSEEAARAPLSRAPSSVVFGAFESRQLVGMLGLYRAAHAKAAHKVNLWGMFVMPEWRGKGLGEQLVETALCHARRMEGVDAAHLGVVESAIAARRLYEKFGFQVWGVEPDAIRIDGRSEREYHLRVTLERGSNAGIR